MKHVAALVAVVLSLTLVAPAFAQPFADVPTDHWAYDAIAELAAKGLIEGYPDGAFRGDRAMTRYEMAMVVARLLARIEAIKIPPLPADLVRTAQLNAAVAAQTAATRAVDARVTALTGKVGTIQRLVAEFRAELAALGVRVTAVEEELAAIRARLDNTRITGDLRFRYNFYPAGSPDGGATHRAPDVRLRGRLTFTGRVAPNVEVVTRLWFANNPGSGTLFDVRAGSAIFFNAVSFDLLHIDVRGVLGANWRFGRQLYSLAAYGPGGGMLFDPANSAAAGSGALYAPGIGTTAGTIDGVRADWMLGPINLTVLLAQDTAAAYTATYTPDRQYQIVRATTGALIPGWTLGGSFYRQGRSPSSAITDPGALAGELRTGIGWGADLSGTLLPGFTIYFDYASWQPRFEVGGGVTTFTGATSNAWRVGGNINLAQIAGITTWNPTLDVQYRNYGGVTQNPLFGHAPRYSFATTTFYQRFDWDMRGWLARLNLTMSPRWSAFVLYESGNVISSGASFSEWWLRVTHQLAPRTNIYVQYTNGTLAGATTSSFYRVELNTSW